MPLDPEDLQDLKDAVQTFEDPGLAVQIAGALGKPIEYGISHLPESVSRKIGEATSAALRSSLKIAVSTMSNERSLRPSNTVHKALTTLSGAVGGAFGIAALAVELPVSTAIMLRSLADIARGEGEDIHDMATQLACIEVFALGSGEADEGVETGYYATRAYLARAVSEAAKFITEKGLSEEGAPAVVRLIAKIAARFSVPVSEKFAAQSIPAIGAAGGAAVNLIFINHFQEIARAHFTVRRLERKYGREQVQAEFERIQQGDK